MVKKTKSKYEDLTHILTTSIADEGYEVDAEVEREIVRLAKYIVNRNELEAEEDDEEDPFIDPEDTLLTGEDLFDDYGDEDDDDEEADEEEDEE